MQIVLYPAAEPRPALKYQLLPPFSNAGPATRPCGGTESPPNETVSSINSTRKDGPWSRIEKWMKIPIGDPREKAYRKKELANDIRMFGGGHIFSDIERAAQIRVVRLGTADPRGQFH